MKLILKCGAAMLMLSLPMAANALVLEKLAKGMELGPQAQNFGQAADKAISAVKARKSVRGATGAIDQLVTESDELICGSWTISMRVHLRNMHLEEHSLGGAEKLKMQKAIAALNQFSAKLQEECTRDRSLDRGPIMTTGYGVTRAELEASTRAFELQRDRACYTRCRTEYAAERAAMKQQQMAWDDLKDAKRNLKKVRIDVNVAERSLARATSDRRSAEKALLDATRLSKSQYQRAYRIRNRTPDRRATRVSNHAASDELLNRLDAKMAGHQNQFTATSRRQLQAEKALREHQQAYKTMLDSFNEARRKHDERTAEHGQKKQELDTVLTACKDNPWQGKWTAAASGGQRTTSNRMVITLTQNGSTVSGTFTDPTGNGTITEGRISGSTLTAKWRNNYSRQNGGTLIWRLGDDRDAFSGRWQGEQESSGSWSGDFVSEG